MKTIILAILFLSFPVLAQVSATPSGDDRFEYPGDQYCTDLNSNVPSKACRWETKKGLYKVGLFISESRFVIVSSDTIYQGVDFERLNRGLKNMVSKSGFSVEMVAYLTGPIADPLASGELSIHELTTQLARRIAKRADLE